jgi:hypothetical protein
MLSFGLERGDCLAALMVALRPASFFDLLASGMRPCCRTCVCGDKSVDFVNDGFILFSIHCLISLVMLRVCPEVRHKGIELRSIRRGNPLKRINKGDRNLKQGSRLAKSEIVA